MKKVSKKCLLAGVLATGILMLSGSARGDILLSLAGTAASGANTKYTYDVFLTPGSMLVKSGTKGNAKTGDLFTLYDFVGLVGTPTLSSTLKKNGFTKFSIQNTGINPANIAPTDDPNVPNITFKYTRSRTITNPAGGMDMLLGQFSLVSKFGPSDDANVLYASATQKSGDQHLANNVGDVVGPQAIPEPATLTLVGICFPVLGGFAYLRRRKREQE